MHFSFKISVIFLVIFYSGWTTAGVYRCIDQSGIFEFSDRPCLSNVKKQVFLPYVYHRTRKTETALKTHELQKEIKQLAILEKRRFCMQVRLQKQMKKEAAKKERLKIRCTKTREKIKNIESQLRLGCKLRRCQRLKRELNHSYLMQNRYCSTG